MSRREKIIEEAQASIPIWFSAIFAAMRFSEAACALSLLCLVPASCFSPSMAPVSVNFVGIREGTAACSMRPRRGYLRGMLPAGRPLLTPLKIANDALSEDDDEEEEEVGTRLYSPGGYYSRFRGSGVRMYLTLPYPSAASARIRSVDAGKGARDPSVGCGGVILLIFSPLPARRLY